MTRVEWPKGSGQYADYNDAEVAFMNEFRWQYERGEISYRDWWKQTTVFHELKMTFPELDISKNGGEPELEQPAVDRPPIGTPGTEGGRVPTWTKDEAIAHLARCRPDEFGWLVTRALLIALRDGEYHSESTVGLKLLSQKNVGAVAGSLLSRHMFEQLNKHGVLEERISSDTSRRKSKVCRLTPKGRPEAERLAADPRVVAWAFPEEL